MAEPGTRYRIGVDVGGTFTDLMVLDAQTGAVHALKTPTTPADPSEGLLAGIAEAAERLRFEPGEVGFILHGTTIATNTVLERKLPEGALIANKGFADVLEIGRHVRREPYTLKPTPQTVLVPRDRRYGVEGRMRWDGSEEVPLDEEAVARAARALSEAGVGAVAVVFLHAYRDPAHERRVAEILAEAAPGIPVSLSSEVSPEIREFERASTTVLNALLVPVVRVYLEQLEGRLRKAGLDARLYLVQSNGGVTTPAQAARLPVRLLLSGPSGGAMAAAELAQALRRPNLVAVDMGGTSFDVSVVRDGESTVVTEGEIDGLPVRLPMVEMRTIGAGGGSIASVAAGGALSVGPRSAGADPGPVAYGKGGVEPTVTDANIVLGRLDPDFFLGGALKLDADRARAAVAERIAAPLGLGVEEAAEGILAVVNANMASAIKLSLFEKGADPRDFAIAAFGGAGGLHAVSFAEELEMAEVVFPRDPGTFSARGILTADIAHDVARSRLLDADEDALPVLAGLAAELVAEGHALLGADGIAEDARHIRLAADMRYRGQAYELLVPWGDAKPDGPSLARLVADFHDLHQARYAHSDPGAPVEIVTLRATARGLLSKPAIEPPAAVDAGPKGERRVWIGGGWRQLPIYDRDRLPEAIEGPVLIEETHATLLVPPGWRLAMSSGGDLVARRGGEGP